MMRKTANKQMAGKNRMAGKGTSRAMAKDKAMAKGKMAQKRTKGYAKGGPVRGNAKKC